MVHQWISSCGRLHRHLRRPIIQPIRLCFFSLRASVEQTSSYSTTAVINGIVFEEINSQETDAGIQYVCPHTSPPHRAPHLALSLRSLRGDG